MLDMVVVILSRFSSLLGKMLELVRAKNLTRKKTRTRSSWTAPMYDWIVILAQKDVLKSPTTQCCPGRDEDERSISCLPK